ncbi:hypothetical protein [Sphingomonas bacterium]|uniref:hypothetical protein n=1 Tax=Sphingomonas bacterium TaxID=1895847 RepID=UPI001576E8D0|nr:hypothetical protein [Sphingomonas bacterium]
MTDEPENLTLRLLQELRQEMADMRSDLREMRSDMREMRKDLTQRVNGLAIMLTSVAGIMHDHEERIEKLEFR